MDAWDEELKQLPGSPFPTSICTSRTSKLLLEMSPASLEVCGECCWIHLAPPGTSRISLDRAGAEIWLETPGKPGIF